MKPLPVARKKCILFYFWTTSRDVIWIRRIKSRLGSVWVSLHSFWSVWAGFRLGHKPFCVFWKELPMSLVSEWKRVADDWLWAFKKQTNRSTFCACVSTGPNGSTDQLFNSLKSSFSSRSYCDPWNWDRNEQGVGFLLAGP